MIRYLRQTAIMVEQFAEYNDRKDHPDMQKAMAMLAEIGRNVRAIAVQCALYRDPRQDELDKFIITTTEITLVMAQGHCEYSTARDALITTKGSVLDAIISINGSYV